MPDSQTPQTPPPHTPSPQTRWAGLAGSDSGRDYAARFAAMAAAGKDMHGEATFCAALLDPGARVLDAGCGTGRVAIRLSELGIECVGVDVDDSMLAVAREAAPDIAWFQGDLASLDLGDPGPFDMVVLAGNVVPLLAPGTVVEAVGALAALLRSEGLLVAGFGLDEAHLPGGCPVTPLAEYDEACDHQRLELVDRFGTWERASFTGSESGYAVSVHTPRVWRRKFARNTGFAAFCPTLAGSENRAQDRVMNENEARRLIKDHFDAATDDQERSAKIYADDAVLEFPQGGERIRGRENIIAFRSAYPARLTFEMHRTTGSGDVWVNEYTIRYDDARPHKVAGIMEFRHGKVFRERLYITEPWEPPEWRARWVEVME